MLLAQTAAELPPMALLGSGLVGCAVVLACWAVIRALQSDDLRQGDDWRYDITRINMMRRSDFLYRLFYPIIQILTRFNRGMFKNSLPEIDRELQAAGYPRYWIAEEFLARSQLIALLVSPALIYFCIELMGQAGIVSGLVFTVLTAYLLRRRLAGQARRRIVLIKRRMPFLLDLMTLLMEAGATFLQALEEGVHEYRGHPIAQEFGRVLKDINMGKTRTEAFDSMQQRLSDDEITNILGSIIQGEHLGTPLARVFRTQADVLRLKRSQRAETIANEAGVNMLLPTVLVMLATVLIMLGPFVIQFMYAELFF